MTFTRQQSTSIQRKQRESASRPSGQYGDGRIPALLLWLLYLLMTLPKNFVSLFSNPPDPGAAAVGTAINNLLWLILTLVGPLLIIRHIRLAWKILRNLNAMFSVFCVLVLASMIWSAAPIITLDRFRRLVTMVSCCVIAVILGWHNRRFQDLLRPPITFLLVGSIFYGLAFPDLAVEQSTAVELHNAWRGLTFQKNVFGVLATYGVIFWFHAWLGRSMGSMKCLLGLGISLICLLLSRSTTSLMTAAFSVTFLALALRSPQSLRRYTPYFVGIFVCLVAVYALAALGVIPELAFILDPISSVTGKNASQATGRAPIWALIEAEIARHPILGIGYGAYWVGPIAGTASFIFVTAISFYAGSAHNGYLEVTNDLGYVGLACLIGYVLIFVRQSLRLWRTDRYEAALYLVLILEQCLANLSEAQWFQVTTENFVVMTLATCALTRASLDEGARARTTRRSPPGPDLKMPRGNHRLASR
jgi:exopolysaccharide production protein ExoQ